MKTKWTNPEIQRCLPRHVRSALVRSTMQNFRTLGKGDQRNFGPLPSRKGNDDSFSVDQAKVLRTRESRYPMRARYQQILLVSVHDHLIVIPPKNVTNSLHKQLNQAKKNWQRFLCIVAILGAARQQSWLERFKLVGFSPQILVLQGRLDSGLLSCQRPMNHSF